MQTISVIDTQYTAIIHTNILIQCTTAKLGYPFCHVQYVCTYVSRLMATTWLVIQLFQVFKRTDAHKQPLLRKSYVLIFFIVKLDFQAINSVHFSKHDMYLIGARRSILKHNQVMICTLLKERQWDLKVMFFLQSAVLVL